MPKRSKQAPANKKKFHINDLHSVQPLSDGQKLLFDTWNTENDMSLFVYGPAGTGKTYAALYLAIKDVLDKTTPFENIIVVRSTVPTRDVGFLPGTLEEKVEAYQQPYVNICDDFFPWDNSYDNMKEKGLISFQSTAFLRGTTFDNTIVLVDESQNMTFQELDTIITRIGKDSKIVFCGDIQQTDLLYKKNDRTGFTEMLSIIEHMEDYFVSIKFDTDDIVRSGLVKKYLTVKEDIDSLEVRNIFK